MTTHPSPTAGRSQCAKILARLQATPGEWVSMRTLARVSKSLNVHKGGQIHSFYRLLSEESRATDRRPLDAHARKVG